MMLWEGVHVVYAHVCIVYGKCVCIVYGHSMYEYALYTHTVSLTGKKE